MRSLPVRVALAAASLVLAAGGALPSPIGAAALVDDSARLAAVPIGAAGQGSRANDGRDPSVVEAARETLDEHRAMVEALVAAERARIAPPAVAPEPAVTSEPAQPRALAATVTPRSPYAGANHMWFPALGYDRSISAYPCSSSAYPANVVYRWGCAGANNVYLFGHAWGVMKPLHDAYVAGRLRLGMEVAYADGAGAIHTYRITAWKLVEPADSGWAIAAQPVPSMTLQTCVGTNSEYRLIVRLVRAS